MKLEFRKIYEARAHFTIYRKTFTFGVFRGNGMGFHHFYDGMGFY